MNFPNSTLVILGMHRSGTSLCANWLQQCGLNIGDRLMGAGVGNRSGHFEDLDFHDFHEDVFQSYNIFYGGLVAAEPLSLKEYQKNRLDALILLKNEMEDYWGFKDPRACLFLDHYHNRLRNPRYLVLYRSYEEVVHSLWNRKNADLANNNVSISDCTTQDDDELWISKSVDAWISYNQKLLSFIQTLPQAIYFASGLDLLHERDQEIITWLNSAGYGLEHVLFSTVFDARHISDKSSLDINLSASQKREILSINDQFKELINSKPSSTKDCVDLTGHTPTEAKKLKLFLCEQFSEMDKLFSELESKTKEIKRLGDESEVNRGNYECEIQRLNLEIREIHNGYQTEIERLNQIIETANSSLISKFKKLIKKL